MTNFTNYLSARDASGVQASAQGSTAAEQAAYASAQALSAHLEHLQMSFPSKASNGTYGIVPFGLIPEAASVVSAWFTPHADQAGSATNYGDIKVINLGTAGSGTAILASKTLSAAGASGGSNQPVSMALSSTVSMAASAIIGVSYTKAGNGIDLVAHSIEVVYRRA